MKIIVAEDEPIALRQMIRLLEEVCPGAEIFGFDNAVDVLGYLESRDADIAFLDIELGSMSGVEIARNIKSSHPLCNIVFCTGYSEYMPEGFNLGVSDYLLKPVTAEKIRHAMDNLRHPLQFSVPKDTVYARCFGAFEIFYNDVPLSGITKRAKELFAFLVEKRGSMCTTRQILDAVFPDKADVNLRMGRSELEEAFSSIGKNDILIRDWGKLGINPEKIVCDLYEYQDGNPDAERLYRGVYMEGYDWAEKTRKSLKASKFPKLRTDYIF